ncbi:biosynthetic-type acetolactate synthase large subunit [Lacticaseibacillus baoqingensis]|uniref:Acetolactate synthase n=1 Tax=Lacticaseibacillus baoqingensis TaxID=2486013 RepID=A0ABW4E6X9_9LACO|nr:biosynthetic-type acetolactate synthase large subunit [Lacticaseibacillus baoqingensis]
MQQKQSSKPQLSDAIKLSGAEILIDALVKEKANVVFGYPGGAILPEYDVMYQKHFNNILVRHEQGAAHAAEGYAKSTGKTGVVFVTSGPGATNAITGIADGMRDSVPMVIFTGQVGTAMIGTDAFQEVDILSLTKSVTKAGFQPRRIEDVAATVSKAFTIAASGRKGPVVVDLPKDVMSGKITPAAITALPPAPEATRLSDQAKTELHALMTALHKAQKPLLIAGGGVVSAQASPEFNEFAHQHQIPVVATLLGLGVMPNTDPLFMGMAGMHGSFAANMALHNCDLLINVGCRFEDRFAPNTRRFAPNAQVAHIDIDPNEIGKIITTTYGIVADAKQALTAMLTSTSSAAHHLEWVEECRDRRHAHPYHYNHEDGKIKPQQLIEEVGALTEGKAYIVTDVGQHQMWAAQYYPYTFPGQLVTSGGLGTMGFGLPAAIGTQFAHPDQTIILITGDGSLQMTSEEMDVLSAYGLNVKVILLNNGTLGMVRQWQDLFYDERRSQTVFHEQPDFQKLAQAYGIENYLLDPHGDWKHMLQDALSSEHSALIEVPIPKLEAVSPMIAPGQSNDHMMGI